MARGLYATTIGFLTQMISYRPAERPIATLLSYLSSNRGNLSRRPGKQSCRSPHLDRCARRLPADQDRNWQRDLGQSGDLLLVAHPRLTEGSDKIRAKRHERTIPLPALDAFRTDTPREPEGYVAGPGMALPADPT